MAEVKILVEGYAIKKTDKATSSCVLIIDSDLKVLVDPGIDRAKLLDGLAKENLKPSDINYVVISHTHLDHCGLAGIFENAKLVDDGAVYSFDGGYEEYENSKIIPSDNIEIIKTPGHDPFHCSVIVKTNDGTVAVAEDVFWWWDEEEQKTDRESLLVRQDPYVKNEKDLLASRKKILELADYIIPGHGKMFKVEK